MVRRVIIALSVLWALLAPLSLAQARMQVQSPPPRPALPPVPWKMSWDHRPEALRWTHTALDALARYDDVFAARIPHDVQNWCPAYPFVSLAERRAFWAALLSVTAKHESTWNPLAIGGGDRWIGLMQIAPHSADYYGCEATTSEALLDPQANLECAVEILAFRVDLDKLVSGPEGKRGIGHDWAPLRSDRKRRDMIAWTRKQSYCALEPIYTGKIGRVEGGRWVSRVWGPIPLPEQRPYGAPPGRPPPA